MKRKRKLEKPEEADRLRTCGRAVVWKIDPGPRRKSARVATVTVLWRAECQLPYCSNTRPTRRLTELAPSDDESASNLTRNAIECEERGELSRRCRKGDEIEEKDER